MPQPSAFRPALLIAAVVFVTRAASAQAPDPHAARLAEASGLVHEVWTIEDGLPLSHLNGVIQPRDGYLWLASFDGLVRFDGVRFTVFNTATNPELPTNRFVSIAKGPDGSVWAVAEFDYVVRWTGGDFEVYGLGDDPKGTAIKDLQFDSAGAPWVTSNRGLYVMRDDRLVLFGDESARLRVLEFFLDASGAVWIGTDGQGALRVRAGEAERVIAGETGPLSSLASSFAETADGTVYIGTGVAVLAYRDGSVERLLPAGADELWVRALRPLGGDSVLVISDRGLFTLHGREIVELRPEIKATSSGPISLLTDSNGDRWLAIQKRLYRNEELVFEGKFPIAAITFDHEGSLWIAADGLHRLKPALFRVYGAEEGAVANVYAIFEDSRRRIWLGSLAGGIALYEHGRFRILETGASLPQTVFEDRAGRVWIGGINYGGCIVEDLRCARRISFLSGHTVKAIYQDRTGAMWFGTDRGLYRDSDGDVQHFTSENGLPHDFVRVIHETRDGALWFGTNGGGVARYQDGLFEHLSAADGLSSDLVRSIHEDEAGVLWIGTEDGGLNRVRVPAEGEEAELSEAKITVIRRRDGLSDDGLHAILDDGQGRFWMSGNRGIFWVLRSDLEDFTAGRASSIHSIAYTERDGLRNREANGGVQSPAIVASDGRLWFAMQAGVAVVDPARTHRSDVPISVEVEEVRSEGTPPKFAGPQGSRPLGLDARQRDFEIAYTALSFLAPDNLRFQYRLDGFQNDWIEAGNRRTAFFTNVPPGSYAFRVRATRGDGIWYNADQALNLTVAPYFHETAWFRIIVGVGVLLVALVGIRAHDRRLQRRARQLEQRVAERTATIEAQAMQLRELDAAKSRFFANISHDFRTPLTLMIGPLEDLRAGLHGSVGPEIDREITLALRNSQRLLKLVDQLLDVARLEANRVELRAQSGDIVEFLRGLLLALSPLAERKRVAVRLDEPPGPCEAYYDPDLMEKVFVNLVGNALKYTPEDGAVRISVQAIVPVPGHPDFTDMPEGYVTVQVKDSGPGIPADDLPYVFERFYRATGADESQGGTGLGLSLACELVELHGGRIEADSEEGFGATFTVTLPLGKAHFDSSQLTEPAEARTSGAARSFSPLKEVELRIEHAPDEGSHGARTEETVPLEADSPTVLLIDDNADLRAYVAKHLRAASYRAVEALTGEDGLRLARDIVPDCIVSDIMMPGLDGQALCREVKSDPDLDFVPLILLTARAGREQKLEGLSEGADDYLTKPFDVGELVARVGNLIASRQRLSERFRRRGKIHPAPVGGASRDEAFLERVRQVLETHLGDADFNVDALARSVSQSRSQLYRRLHETLGQSPSGIIQQFRLERSANLLTARAGTVSEIAFGVGFKSVSHFCRRFRAQYGVSPSAYSEAVGRKKHQA